MCDECPSLKTQIAALLAEGEALMERYQVTEAGRYAAERQVRRLKAELNGSTTPETQRIKDVCTYHDERWCSTYPNARGLKYPMDGNNAAAVRKVLRWGFSVEDIKQIIDGAFASEFHRSKPKYLYLSSLLGDEGKIRNHLVRADEQKAAEIAEQIRAQPLWPPVDRVLLELRRLGIEPVKADGKVLDDRRVWLHEATCPLCQKTLRVGEMFENGHASVECAAGCDLFSVLDALHLWPVDLTQRSDPLVEWIPLFESDQRMAA
jgi:hypothetical protein